MANALKTYSKDATTESLWESIMEYGEVRVKGMESKEAVQKLCVRLAQKKYREQLKYMEVFGRIKHTYDEKKGTLHIFMVEPKMDQKVKKEGELEWT